MDVTRATWRKSSYSGTNGGNCVEAGVAGKSLAVRDSKDPHGSVLTIDPGAWRTFIGQLKDGKRVGSA
jgi:hypothetical protein